MERKMFCAVSNSIKGATRAIAVAFLLTSLVPLALPADKKKPAPPAPAPKNQRIGVDTSKLIWPQPPAITRLKYLDHYTGEKIDWAKVNALQESSKKSKLTWKDKLAGTDPKSAAGEDYKMPFQLLNPTAIAFDSKGQIYIADSKVGAIFIYDSDKKTTSFILGGKSAHFGHIAGMVMDDADRLFVSDSKLHRVIVLNSKGEEEERFGTELMVSPAGIALDRENRYLYVVDSQLDQVLVYDADTHKLIRRMGTSGKKHTLTDPGNFSLPTHCAVDADGNLFVTDTLNNRVEEFDADGNFIRQWGKAGDAPGRFGRPKGIAIDHDGHVWVADALLQRLQVFNQEGRLLMYVGAEGQLPGMFSALAEVAIDGKSRVVTAEEFPARAQVFQYVTDEQAVAEAAKRDKEKEDKAAARKQPSANAALAQDKIESKADMKVETKPETKADLKTDAEHPPQ
jgi:DNA-binding beta-propeller fold protein YncE